MKPASSSAALMKAITLSQQQMKVQDALEAKKKKSKKKGKDESYDSDVFSPASN